LVHSFVVSRISHASLAISQLEILENSNGESAENMAFVALSFAAQVCFLRVSHSAIVVSGVVHQDSTICQTSIAFRKNLMRDFQ
jgi:hypothetical protein